MPNDIAYSVGAFIPDGEAYPDRWERLSRDFRETEAAIGRARLNHPYGDGDRQRLDLFHPAGRAEGLLIFVHGGYWMRFGREWWSHYAAGATARGWAVAMPSYPLAPEARIAEITGCIARAVDVAATLVPGPVRLTGHSAGGHLVSRMLDPDQPIAARDRIDRAVPISPLADLRPLLESAMNRTLGLDAAEAGAESPVLQPAPEVPVTVWVGAEERPVFLDQARWLADAWACGLRIAPGRHHFDVIDDLREPGAPLTRALLDD